MSGRVIRTCANPECGEPFEATRHNQAYCHPAHRPNRGGSKARGPRPQYGAEHQRMRAQLAPVVEAGEAYCTEPICLMDDGRWIQPGSPWHLAHDREAGPGKYRGPAHERCNASEGARYLRRLQRAEVGDGPANRWVV